MEREKLAEEAAYRSRKQAADHFGGCRYRGPTLVQCQRPGKTILSVGTTLHGLRQEVRVAELSHEEGEPTMSKLDLAPPVVGQCHLVPQLPVETRYECTRVTKLPL